MTLEELAKWHDEKAAHFKDMALTKEGFSRDMWIKQAHYHEASAAAIRELADKREQRDYGDILSGPFNAKLDEVTDAALAKCGGGA